MKCDCIDCEFRGMELCEHRKAADELAAHRREVAELKRKMNDVVCENEALRDACATCSAKREVAELKRELELTRQQRNRARLDVQKKFVREVMELRECLKEAVEWSCGNPDEACEDCVAHGGDTPCKCEKWRKALEGAKDEKDNS